MGSVLILTFMMLGLALSILYPLVRDLPDRE